MCPPPRALPHPASCPGGRRDPSFRTPLGIRGALGAFPCPLGPGLWALPRGPGPLEGAGEVATKEDTWRAGWASAGTAVGSVLTETAGVFWGAPGGRFWDLPPTPWTLLCLHTGSASCQPFTHFPLGSQLSLALALSPGSLDGSACGIAGSRSQLSLPPSGLPRCPCPPSPGLLRCPCPSPPPGPA